MTEHSIQLADGRLFDLLSPDPELIEIETIAHSLSQICRFTGHCDRFYSVAQHCVVVSRLVPSEFALAGLLHDATEAFVGDVSSPLKRLLPLYKEIEERIWGAIAERFRIDYRESVVKPADLAALATERRDLGMQGNDEYWVNLPPPAPWAIVPQGPYQARNQFLARYIEISLHPGRGQAPSREEVMNKAPRGPAEAREYERARRRESSKETSLRLAREEEDEKDRWEVIG